MRYFRADEATYESVRAAIDAANGWARRWFLVFRQSIG